MDTRFAPQQKLVLHSQFSDYLKGKKVYPINVEISPSGVCQASCAFCFFAHTDEDHGGHRKVFLDYTRLLEILDECKELGVKSIAWTGGGEPTLHPNFPTLVEEVHKLGLRQGVFTNALSIPKYKPEYMDWIRITMTDKPYQVPYIKMLRGTEALGFAFNYGGTHDLPYLEDTIAVAEVVKADYVQVRPALKLQGETTNIDPPQVNHPLVFITSYKFEDAKHKHSYNKCEGYHFLPYIREDGDVDVCSYMRGHGGYTLGNIYQKDLKEILDNAPQHVPVHPKCQVCCRLDQFNQSIHTARQLKDVDFP